MKFIKIKDKDNILKFIYVIILKNTKDNNYINEKTKSIYKLYKNRKANQQFIYIINDILYYPISTNLNYERIEILNS